jgi:oxygen-independent coproporphyrinogen III oxidase
LAFLLLISISFEGLNLNLYRDLFETEALIDYPELSELLSLDLASKNEDTINLTEFGIERSDTLGFWFFSVKVRRLMAEYELI